MDLVKVNSEIKKTIYDELFSFFDQLFGREQQKLLTQADIELALSKVSDALAKKLDLLPGSEVGNAGQNALRSFFSQLFRGKETAIVDRAGLEGILEGAASAVEQMVQQGIAAKFIDDRLRRDLAAAGIDYPRAFSTPQADEKAISRLRNAGMWPHTFNESGLPVVFAALAKSSAVVTFAEGGNGAMKQGSPVEALERLMRWLSRNVSQPDLENAGFAARRRGTVPVAFKESHGGRIDYASVLLAEAAQDRATEKQVPFGQALRELREEGFLERLRR